MIKIFILFRGNDKVSGLFLYETMNNVLQLFIYNGYVYICENFQVEGYYKSSLHSLQNQKVNPNRYTDF